MQISYLLYDGSAYPKLTPPVSSPYQTTLSLSLSLSISFLPSLTAFHSLPLSLSLSFFLPPPFFHPFSPTERALLYRAVPRRLRSTRFSHPYLSSPLLPVHISTTHTHTRTRRVSSIYSLLDSRARSSAFAFLAHAFPTSSRSCTHGVSHLWRMLLSLFMTRTVLILGLASKGLFKGRRTATPGMGCLSLSLFAVRCFVTESFENRGIEPSSSWWWWVGGCCRRRGGIPRRRCCRSERIIVNNVPHHHPIRNESWPDRGF